MIIVAAIALTVLFALWVLSVIKRGHPMRPTPKRRTNNDRHPSQGGQE